MRPTTKDLAKAAGVSLATVDRVLNGRSGVRKKTVEAVNEAIGKIGFERNQLAATLARQKGLRFGFALPKDGDEFLAEILKHLNDSQKMGRAEMLEVKSLRIDGKDPHKAARSLSRIKADEFDGIAIMASETPQIRDAIHRMRERGIAVIPFVSNQEDGRDENFVGIDNKAAGATAGRLMGRFSGDKKGAIAVLTDTMQARDSLERRLGFDSVINADFANLTVLPSLETYGDAVRTETIINTVFDVHKDLAGIYLMGSEARLALEAITRIQNGHNHIKIAHEKTPSTTAALLTGNLDAVVTQDPGHLVRSAIRKLRARCENRRTLTSQEKIRIEVLLADNL